MSQDQTNKKLKNTKELINLKEVKNTKEVKTHILVFLLVSLSVHFLCPAYSKGDPGASLMELPMWTQRQRTDLKNKILRKYFRRCNYWQTTANSLLLKTHTFVFAGKGTMFDKKSIFLWPDKYILWTSGARMIKRENPPCPKWPQVGNIKAWTNLAQKDHK